MSELLQRFEAGRLLFDGGMGSMLIDRGLPNGHPPEEWNASHPDVVRAIHVAYLGAGADVIETNTFGGTPMRLGAHDLAARTLELNAAGVKIAREAASEASEKQGRECFVAFSIGPCGEMMAPVGSVDAGDIREAFERQVACLRDADAPDLIVIETMFDIREAHLALEAAKAVFDGPVAVALTLGRNPRGFFTIMGNEAAASARELVSAGADIVGVNCSIASDDMVDLSRDLRAAVTAPVLCQPNAGSPAMRDGKPVYEQAADAFVTDAMELFDNGINAVGGCCGTTPEFIGALARALAGD